MSRRLGLVVAGVLLCPALVAQAGASTGSTADLDYPVDVEAQFAALTERADAMGFHMGDAPFDPSLCRHWQGVARSQGEGTPYLFVARSGNQPPAPCIQWCEDNNVPCTEVGDGPGHLVVVEMGSRDTSGERLRSNRLQRGVDQEDTVPDARDRIVTTVTFDGTDGWPAYGHPGGLQLVGDVLVVPLETPYEGSQDVNEILFVDVSDPTVPTLISTLPVDVTDTFTAGLAGIAPRADGRWLLVVAGLKDLEVRFYVSDSTDLKDEHLGWTLADTFWPEDDPLVEYCGGWPGGSPNPFGGDFGWPGGGLTDVAYQSLNLVREDGPGGTLYLIGGRATSQIPGLGSDWFDLYRVEEHADGTIGLACVHKHHVQTWPTLDPSPLFKHNLAHFAAATGVHVTPSGQLVLYGTEHDNDGPGGTVKFGEWRNFDMVTDGSPSYDPTVAPTSTWTVPEGGSVDIRAIAAPPTTKAWVQLFADPDWTDDRYVVIDYDDWVLDDHDDFRNLDEGPFGDGFSNQATSARWFAPIGCRIVLRDHPLSNPDPGDDTATIFGTGVPQKVAHLDNLPHDNGQGGMDDDVTAVVFDEGCDAYYDPSRYDVSWDLDADGTYETAGPTPTFSAAGLDGPTLRSPGIRVEHPDDGRTGNAVGEIRILNVAPTVTTGSLLDPAGRDVLTDDVPLLTGIPLQLTATFDDAGEPDTHSVSIDWGDGTTTDTSGLAQFTPATGPGEGSLAVSHEPAAAGTRTITLTITDDDGGTVMVSAEVTVLQPAAAIQWVADELSDLRPGLSGDDRAVVEGIIASLLGQQGDGSSDGAIDHIEGRSVVAAMVALDDAVDALEHADPAIIPTADTLAGTLALVAHAVADAEIADAADRSPGPPASLMARAERAHVAAGTHLALGEWSGAVADDRAAVQLVTAN